MSEEVKNAWETLQKAMKEDEEFAWAVHCNIAMPIMDSIGVTHHDANIGAVRVMETIFKYNSLPLCKKMIPTMGVL